MATPPAPPMRAAGWWLCVLCAALLGPAGLLHAQSSLYLVNSATKVKQVSFKGNDTFDDAELKAQIVTTAPTLWNLITFWSDERHFFNPVELQKDVARLRRFYRRNGFLHPFIDYNAAYDSTKNIVRVLFSVEEGPPLSIMNIDFLGPDGRPAFYQFSGANQDRWQSFREANTRLRVGDRLSRFELTRIRDRSLEWLNNRGYAYSRVCPQTDVDSTDNYVDLRFRIHAGPINRFGPIIVEGNERIATDLILREMPFAPGDRYNRSKLIEGQRQLFASNLFRVALVDVVPPPRDPLMDECVVVETDTLATIRVLVQEAPLRAVGAETGYSKTDGVGLRGTLRHRNFLGGARNASLSGELIPNIGALRGDDLRGLNQWRVALALRQPYLFTNQLSGGMTAFIEREETPAYSELDTGLTTTLIYEFFTYRTMSLEHTFTLADSLGPAGQDNIFRRSVLSLSGSFGKANDYLLPTRGYFLRPFVEWSSNLIGSDLQYFKAGLETTVYRRVTRRIGLAGRVFGGQIWSLNDTQDLTGARFSRIRFYAGGANDVRGWSNQGLGPIDSEPLVVQGDTLYRPLGGDRKFSGNVELRLPFPGLGRNWETAAFLDFGKVGDEPIRYGTGTGVRYRTPIGFLRFDVAYKVNPSPEDLREAAAFYRDGLAAPEIFSRRIAYHVSIGYAF